MATEGGDTPEGETMEEGTPSSASQPGSAAHRRLDLRSPTFHFGL